MGTGGSFPGAKRPGLEADHLPPSSVEVENSGAIPPLPQCLHGIVLNELSTKTTLSLPFTVDLINLAQGRIYWLCILNTVMDAEGE
jgi:hypothetical protein